MNKVLLVFPYNLNENTDEFNKMTKKFEINGYDIINFNGIDNNFDLMSLPNYINYTKDQLGGKIDRISVLSNVREFIFVWYRAYNSLIDDFIYFIDRDYENVFLSDNNLENKFYLKIKDFVGIKNESIEGKIFININYNNYNQLFDFMLADYKFSSYFNDIDNFNFNKKVVKSPKNKIYTFKDYKMDFVLNIFAEQEKVILNNYADTNAKINLNDLVNNSLKNCFLIPYIIIELFKRINQRNDAFIINYLKELNKLDLRKRKKIIGEIILYLSEIKFDFKKISLFISLLSDLVNDRDYTFNKLIALINFYNKEFTVEPVFKQLDFHLKLLETYYKQNQYPEVIDMAERYLERYPYDKNVLNIYAECLNKLIKKDVLPRNKDNLPQNVKFISDDELLNKEKKYVVSFDNSGLKETIIFIKGQSKYNVTRYSIEGFSISFRKLGYKIIIIDYNTNGLKDLYKSILKSNVKLVFSFNGKVIKHITNELKYFKDICFFNRFVDHPVYHYNRLKNKLNNEIVTFADRKHVEFYKEIFDDKNCFFLPSGATFNFYFKNKSNKETDIIFAGTVNDPNIYRNKWLKENGKIAKIFDSLLEHALSKEFLIIKKDLNYILAKLNFSLNDFNINILYEYSQLVDRYVRSYRRIKVVNKLSQFNVKLFGKNWDKCISSKNNLIIEKSISFKKLIQEINNAKISINVLPEFSEGGHERILNSMYYGTMVATNVNKYLREHFEDGKDILFFNWNDLDLLVNKINYYLNNKKELRRIAVNGQKNVQKHHTNFHRAKEIINYLKN